MFIIFYKDGHQESTCNEINIQALDWADVVMVVNMNNVKN